MSKFIVTGAARSGTRYMACLLTMLGVPCGWERAFNPDYAQTATQALAEMDSRGLAGDSSWFAAGYLAPVMNDLTVIHLVRNPLQAIASLHVCGFMKPACRDWAKQRFAFARVPIAEGEDSLGWCAKYWIAWNRMLRDTLRDSGFRSRRVRIEELRDGRKVIELVKFLGYGEPAGRHVKNCLETLPHSVNTGGRSRTQEKMRDRIRTDEMREAAEEFGYTL